MIFVTYSMLAKFNTINSIGYQEDNYHTFPAGAFVDNFAKFNKILIITAK